MRLVILMFTLLFMTPVQAETLTIITHTMESQPYLNAKILGKYMVKHYPGAKDYVVKAVPGAGGINAANYIYNIASKDGLTFGGFNKGTILASFDSKYANFDLEKFTWLGSTSDSRNNPSVVVSSRKYDGKILNMAEMGSTEGGAVNEIRNITGWNIKRISGYKDGREIRLAFARGEIDAFYIQYTTLLTVDPTLKDKIILQYGNGYLRNLELKSVPTLMELSQSKELSRELAIRELGEILGRPFVAPPGISKEKASLLREAFFKTMNDPEFIAENPIDIDPIFWSQAESIIRQIRGSKQSYRDPTL
jgi:hypothetical protein